MPALKRWKKRQIVALAALILLAIPLLPLLVFRFSAESRLQASLAHHPDMPRTREQIAARHSPAAHRPKTSQPEKSDASALEETGSPQSVAPDSPAEIFTKCGAAAEVPKDFWAWLHQWQKGRLTLESRKQLDALRVQYRDLLESLLRMPSSGEGGIFLGDPLDRNSRYRNSSPPGEIMLATLLSLEAESAAAAGNYGRMADVFRAMAAINDVLRQSPAVNVRVYSRWTGDLMTASLEHALGAGLPNSALNAIAPYLAFSPYEDVLREALLAQRDIGQYYLEDPMRYFEMFADADSEPLTRLAFQAFTAGSNATGWTANDQAQFLEQTDELIGITEAPREEQAARLNALTAGLVQWDMSLLGQFHLSRIFLWTSVSAVRDMLNAEMESEAARTALAVEHYRNDTGQLPPSLEALTPGYLRAVPTDRFSGAPLRYRPMGAGYVVYSVGLNGRDDGGLDPQDLQGPDDIVFRVRPEKQGASQEKLRGVSLTQEREETGGKG